MWSVSMFTQARVCVCTNDVKQLCVSVCVYVTNIFGVRFCRFLFYQHILSHTRAFLCTLARTLCLFFLSHTHTHAHTRTQQEVSSSSSTAPAVLGGGSGSVSGGGRGAAEAVGARHEVRTCICVGGGQGGGARVCVCACVCKCAYVCLQASVCVELWQLLVTARICIYS